MNTRFLPLVLVLLFINTTLTQELPEITHPLGYSMSLVPVYNWYPAARSL